MARLNRNQAGANIKEGAVAVSATPQQVVGSRNQRVSLSLRNNGATPVYFGSAATVSVVSGYPILPGEDFELVDFLGALHVVGTSGDLRYFEVY